MDMMAMMKQAQNLQKKLEEAQQKSNDLTAQGQSGGGLVTITIKGDKQVKKVTIDKSIVTPEEVEMLEDLIAAAFNDAVVKVEEVVAKEMQTVTAGLPLPPGMKLPF